MDIASLETPVPVVDLGIAEANIARMQAYADAHGIALRPHIKTHKLPALAHRQLEQGARGITCQKLGEAEVMADAGIDDIFISYPIIGEAKAERLAALAARVKMRVNVDSSAGIETLARAARHGHEIGVVIEFDSGNKRSGVVTVDAAVALAKQAAATPGLRFDGLMTYPTSAASAAFIAEALPKLRAEGLEPAVLSGGGSPKAVHTHEMAPVNELRVGTYVYNDRMMVAAGAAGWEDCALTVHVTVISRPEDDRAIIDAGSKTFAADIMPGGQQLGYGHILEYPDARIDRISEEHGMVDLTACAKKPAIGERLRVVPNHVCPVSNLHDRVATVKDGAFLGFVDVAARGRTL
ncbi:alanine racemase [Roseomonas haemaphysalidis]|uniref:Alanine racemase n=1 Tax=Roseomonas haemaphysalidis TaxID=2768162 RepID=A0ABS3KQD8_9PROT|nr:alanine racemase [Roseomonas haemaphysalidis]MBO1079688.1 alanine racemase [Roseomonas haemaphysalidis]